ncbi:unnamed protein product [Rodentolepis nana]|uniref:CASP-like protein n=1 Tax=Rodentolepis nana TaxID=102285 RepID=A0A0R3TB41_RODNA|nr:unnamed protein product [Rodentolepis nana]
MGGSFLLTWTSANVSFDAKALLNRYFLMQIHALFFSIVATFGASLGTIDLLNGLDKSHPACSLTLPLFTPNSTNSSAESVGVCDLLVCAFIIGEKKPPSLSLARQGLGVNWH